MNSLNKYVWILKTMFWLNDEFTIGLVQTIPPLKRLTINFYSFHTDPSSVHSNPQNYYNKNYYMGDN